MARINLLPWRQEERQRKNKEFNLVLVAAAAVTALLIFLVFMFFNYRLDSQNQANELIKQQNAHLDGVLTEIDKLEEQRTAMLEQIKVIQDLQGRRSIPVRIWDDIARAIPSSMYLISISRENDTITLTGFAHSANVVSSLVRNLDASPWLANSAIPNIKSDVEAYQSNAQKNNKSDDKQQRPIYPEDSYISFTVTTQVKFDEKATENLQQDDMATTDTAVTATEVPTEHTAPAEQVGEPSQAPTDEQPASDATPTIAPTDTAEATPAPEGGQS